MFVSPDPKFRDGIFRWRLGLLGHESGTLVSGISALMWETPQGSFTLLTMWDTVKSQQSVTQKKVLTRTQDCCQLDLGLPASRTVRDAFLLFMSYRLRGFVLATQQVGTALSRYSCYHYLLLLLFLWACVLVAQLCLPLCNLLEPTRLLCPWNSPSKNTGVDCHSLLQGIFQPGVKPRSPILQADSLPSELPGKPHYCYCYYYSILISLAWLLPPNAKWQAATKFPLSQRSPRDVSSVINTQWLFGTIPLLWQ